MIGPIVRRLRLKTNNVCRNFIVISVWSYFEMALKQAGVTVAKAPRTRACSEFSASILFRAVRIALAASSTTSYFLHASFKSFPAYPHRINTRSNYLQKILQIFRDVRRLGKCNGQ